MKEKKKISLTTMIFLAMIIGAVLGLVFGETMKHIQFIGDIWLNCIKMIIVPMVIGTIVTGVTSQKDTKALGRIGAKIMTYYICTTFIACAVGLLVATILKPGYGIDLSGLSSQEVATAAPITFSSFITGLFSSNMVQTFAEGNIIQTLIISFLIGIGIMKMKNEEHKEKAISLFETFNSMIFSLIGLIMKASPIGILCLMASSFGTYGIGVFTTMASLAGTYYLACLIQVLVVYCGFLWLTTRTNPLYFLKNTAELWIYTISTCSSVAAIPVSIKVAKEKFNVPESISGFTIPLGSQMNYDGSVILYGCVIVFIAQTINMPISLEMMIRVVLLSAILSTGGGGIPGSGIVKLMVMVEAFGLPTAIVGIIAAFYRIFDMGTTTNNCLGDLAGTIFVGKTEEKHNPKELQQTSETN